MALSNPFSSRPAAPAEPSSADMKTAVVQQLQSETAMTNARALMTKMQENCFSNCIASPPDSSLSATDQTCLKNCSQKYLALWTAVSRAYVTRLTKEQKAAGIEGAGSLSL